MADSAEPSTLYRLENRRALLPSVGRRCQEFFEGVLEGVVTGLIGNSDSTDRRSALSRYWDVMLRVAAKPVVYTDGQVRLDAAGQLLSASFEIAAELGNSS